MIMGTLIVRFKVYSFIQGVLESLGKLGHLLKGRGEEPGSDAAPSRAAEKNVFFWAPCYFSAWAQHR